MEDCPEVPPFRLSMSRAEMTKRCVRRSVAMLLLSTTKRAGASGAMRGMRVVPAAEEAPT